MTKRIAAVCNATDKEQINLTVAFHNLNRASPVIILGRGVHKIGRLVKSMDLQSLKRRLKIQLSLTK